MPGRPSDPPGADSLPRSATTSARAPAAWASRALTRNVHTPRSTSAIRPRAALEVGRAAAATGARERRPDAPRRRVAQRRDRDAPAAHLEPRRGALAEHRERHGLEAHAVARGAQATGDVVDRRLVAGGAGGARLPVALADARERAQVHRRRLAEPDRRRLRRRGRDPPHPATATATAASHRAQRATRSHLTRARTASGRGRRRARPGARRAARRPAGRGAAATPARKPAASAATQSRTTAATGSGIFSTGASASISVRPEAIRRSPESSPSRISLASRAGGTQRTRHSMRRNVSRSPAGPGRGAQPGRDEHEQAGARAAPQRLLDRRARRRGWR